MLLVEIDKKKGFAPIITFKDGRRIALGISEILYETNEFECIPFEETGRVNRNEITVDELRKSGKTLLFKADDVIRLED